MVQSFSEVAQRKWTCQRDPSSSATKTICVFRSTHARQVGRELIHQKKHVSPVRQAGLRFEVLWIAKSVKRASTLQQQDLMSANVVTKRKDNMRKFQN